MIKLVKFNLLIDGQRCRRIEDLQNNFNLIDVIEEFQNGKLEKWLKVRNFDEQFEQVKAIEKESDLLEIAQQLCKIFEISIGEDDLKNEVMIVEYQRHTSMKRSDDDTVREIFFKFYKGVLTDKIFDIKMIKIKLIDSGQYEEILSEDIRFIPLFKRVELAIQETNRVHFKLKDKNRIIDCPATLKSLTEDGFIHQTVVMEGLSIYTEEMYTSYSGMFNDTVLLYVLDIDNKIDAKSIKNADVSSIHEGKYISTIVNVKS